MKPYAVVVVGPALPFVRNCPRLTFQSLLRLFDALEKHPHTAPDLAEKSDDGRDLYTRFRRRCAVSYWLDEAAREVRVVRIEPLGR